MKSIRTQMFIYLIIATAIVLLHDDNSKSIVVMIVNMARAMGISTTAEGVETDEQFEMLEHIGADRIQGYLISRPVPAEQVPHNAKH